MDDDATEAIFAGRVLVRCGDHLVEQIPISTSAMRAMQFRAYQIEGSFLARSPDGSAWIFMDGRTGGPVRWRLCDSSPHRNENAGHLADLGVRVLDVEQAQEEFKAAGGTLLDVT
jgi:hypothetical protein